METYHGVACCRGQPAGLAAWPWPGCVSSNRWGRDAIPHDLKPRQPMFPARAKRVIFIFMQGGPSHIDTFDYKPELTRKDGQDIDFTGVRFGHVWYP